MTFRFLTVLAIYLATSSVFAQAPDGAQVFMASCSNCHNGAADSRAPAPDALRSRSPEAIIEALMADQRRYFVGAQLLANVERH
jgi:mono/diheme cytochrome c family protein